MGWTDLITLKELSPELRELIMAGGGEGVISGNPIFIDSVYTKKVVATEQDQVEFEIPFEEFDTVNTYLDVKINSTWINPDRYSIEGSRVTLNDGVDIGTVVYFTIFSLAQVTPDGGYIQDVDIAETPQEIIVYDGSVIDEKVSAHNSSNETHADIRELIKSKANQSYVDENFIKTLRIKGAVNEDFNNLIDVGIYRIANNNQPNKPPFEKVHYGILEVLAIPSSSAIKQIAYDLAYNETWIRSKASLNEAWTEWRKLATENTLENKFNLAIKTSEIHNYKKCIEDNWSTLPIGNSQCLISAGSQGSAIVYKLNSDYGSVIIHGYNNYGEILSGYNSSGIWCWRQISTTSKSTNLTLLNGWTNLFGYDLTYSISGNLVTINGVIMGGDTTINTALCSLPSEIQPKKSYYFVVHATDGTYCRLYISENGSTLTHNKITTSSSIHINITYPIE